MWGCDLAGQIISKSCSFSPVPAPGTGGHGFDHGPRHTEVVKNGSTCSCSSLGTDTDQVELGCWVTQCQDNVTGCHIMS